MKHFLVTCTLVLGLASWATAQDEPQTIAGRVTDASGEGLPGVTVLWVGTGNGTVTDFDGNYSIGLPSGLENPRLSFSFIGYQTQVVPLGSQTNVDVTLEEEVTALDDVVITAFGIAEEKKALNFATQVVDSRDIEGSQQVNVVNTLQGQVAGVRVTQSGGSPGASSSIVIRGGSSIDADNQPLFVVDGIPIDNSTIGEPTGSNSSGILARSTSNVNRAADINPQDIESMTILKGPAAAAKYGLRAANGAIIITTKKGKAGQARLNYSNRFSFDWVGQMPDQQEQYIQGNLGRFDSLSRTSWGRPRTADDPWYDNLNNIFGTGFAMQHNMSVSGGSENSTFYISGSTYQNDGVLDNTNFDRYDLRMNGTTKLLDIVTVGASANYINSLSTSGVEGDGFFGDDGGYLISTIAWPRNDDIRNYLNPDGTRRRLLPGLPQDDLDNPLWSLENNPITDEVHRLISNAFIDIQPAPWLNVNYRLGTDWYRQTGASVRSPGTSVTNFFAGNRTPNSNGAISETVNYSQIISSNLLVTFSKRFNEDWNTSLLVGHNLEQRENELTANFGLDFLNPDFAGLNNTDPSRRTVARAGSIRRLVGVFGEWKLDFRGTAYLSVTGRNDWSSTLPVQNRSFFYPSIGGGLIMTELVDLGGVREYLSYWKLRASYAEVGKDAPAHRIESSLRQYEGLGGGFENGVFGGNFDLQPESKREFEIGSDMDLLNGRLGLDVTYFYSRAENLIVPTRGSYAQGFILKFVNNGTVDNRGWEVLVETVPYKSPDITWGVDFNYTRVRNTVVDLPGDLDFYYPTQAQILFGARGAAFEGGSLYGIAANAYETNDQGLIIINPETGLPANLLQDQNIGDRFPDWTLGISNKFNYKQFQLDFLVDLSIGGQVMHGTLSAGRNGMINQGLSDLTGRRYEEVILTGVLENEDGTFRPNNIPISMNQNFYQSVFDNHKPWFLERADWVRLRWVTLTYNLPTALIERYQMQRASVFVSGRNLLLFTPFSGVDPEVDAGGAGVSGGGAYNIEFGGVPGTRGIDFGLKFTL